MRLAVRSHQPRALAPERQIRGDVEVVALRGRLPDDPDTGMPKGRAPTAHPSAAHLDQAQCGHKIADHATHQRRLPGTVLAGDGEQFTAPNRQVDTGEHLQGPEPHAQPRDAQHCGRGAIGCQHGRTGRERHALILAPRHRIASPPYRTAQGLPSLRIWRDTSALFGHMRRACSRGGRGCRSAAAGTHRRADHAVTMTTAPPACQAITPTILS